MLEAYQKIVTQKKWLEMKTVSQFFQGCNRKEVSRITGEEWRTIFEIWGLIQHPTINYFQLEQSTAEAFFRLCVSRAESACLNIFTSQLQEYFDSLKNLLRRLLENWYNPVPGTGFFACKTTMDIVLQKHHELRLPPINIFRHLHLCLEKVINVATHINTLCNLTREQIAILRPEINFGPSSIDSLML